MKWRIILIIWALLFTPLTLYNIFGNPIFFPVSSTQFQDAEISNHNFSLSAPISARGNFSVNLALDKPPSNYLVSARVDVSVDYQTYGAYGAFPLIVTVAENGFFHSPNKQEMDFVLSPPIPPTGAGLALNGQLPDLTVHETFDHLVSGPNVLFLNFTFFSTGINSSTYTAPNYGRGYFKLNIGPFIVSVTDLTMLYSLDAVSEVLLAVLLFPLAIVIRTFLRKAFKSKSVKDCN